VRNELELQCTNARNAKKSLEEFDPTAAKKASDVANYYESIGMLIEHGNRNLLPDVVNMLLDMVHVSAHDFWEIYHRNIVVIHPGPLGSWAGSFENLYFRISEYKPSLPATIQRLERKP
jgi:hypothetical protein